MSEAILIHAGGSFADVRKIKLRNDSATFYSVFAIAGHYLLFPLGPIQPMFQSQQLRGIIPPIITPMQADGTLDTGATRSIIDHVIDGGVSGIFVLGTTGEATGISYTKRHQVIETAIEYVAGRVPVLVGISDTCLEEAIDLADFAFDCGASALVAAAPYFLPVDQSQLERWYIMLAESVRLPLILYNMPSCTKVEIEPATAVRLSAHENILGMKDSSGDIAYFRRVLAMLGDRDFPLLVGPERLLWQTLRSGGKGGVCGGSIVWPRLYSLCVEAHEQGDRELAATCDAMIQKVSQTVYKERGGRRMITEAIKAILESKGVCERWVAPPLIPVDDAGYQSLIEGVTQLESELSNLIEIKFASISNTRTS